MHTPGPWYRNIKPANKYNTIFAGNAPKHTHVCHLSTMGMSAEEVEGNCNLIVAAPDLLAIAIRTVEFLNLFYEVSEQSFGGWYELRKDAQAVIAKAKDSASPNASHT